MAIDTATKRASALLDLGQIPFPPDGTIAAADRGFMLEFYGGIAADEPVTLIKPNVVCVSYPHKHRAIADDHRHRAVAEPHKHKAIS